MKKTTLYQKDSKGRIKVWTCEVVNHFEQSAEIVTHSGLEGGKMTPEVTPITEGKNIGRSNETTAYEQACAEAQSKIAAKIRSGYVADKSQIKESSELGSGVPQPMLAQKYDPKGKQSSSKTLKQIGLVGKIGSVQPKFDGHRRLIHVTKDGVKQYTRKGDLTEALPHITEQLEKKAQVALQKVNALEIWLDGEAFTDEVPFNELSGLLRKEKNHTAEELEKRGKINIRLYDMIIVGEGYEKRYSLLKHFATDNVIVVENHEIELTDGNLQTYLDKFLAEGHEGLMIRQHGIPYENKRTWQLCKFKIFEDEEMEIIGGEESVRRGMLGAFIVRDKKGNECKASLKFSHPERIEMWKNLKNYIGQHATVEYFGRSEYGIPRFPKVKAIRKDV